MQTQPQIRTEPKVLLCGCREDQPCEVHNRDGETMQVLTHVVSEASRIREIEERDISALASHAEQGSDKRFWSLFCFECDEIQVEQGIARKVAEKAYAQGWMIYHGSPLCKSCQDR